MIPGMGSLRATRSRAWSHRRHVVREKKACFGGSPLENLGISEPVPTSLLNADDIHARKGASQRAHDVVIEVFVRCKSESLPCGAASQQARPQTVGWKMGLDSTLSLSGGSSALR
jgi:hypothetical protein